VDVLLEDGLDRYFNGRFEDAIHLWTRVLFFDRSHARARAYIDRARTALAEQHRRSEELLQASRDLLNQGQTEAARRLLADAMAARGDEVQTAALRVQLERVERAHAPSPRVTPAATPHVEQVPGWAWHRTRPLLVAVTTAGIVFLAAGVLAFIALTEPADVAPPLKPAAAGARLASPSASEVALVRARTLFAAGRLSEALQKLEKIGPQSPDRPAADQLRIDIQQLLLASVRPSNVEANRR
jgi:thioredoxin-like negative regulator of GroEL